MTARLLNMAFELQGMKQGLDRVAQAHRDIGSPADRFSTIHVAGTNGKGSVTTKLAAAVQESGKKVGLFTSPHIRDVKERVQINGRPIENLDAMLERVFPLELSYFETITLAAFLAFAEEGVEVGVIETGLGGRLDATNIITPMLSVITSIGWDHMRYLGDTLEAIAREKAGIIKPGIPVVIGPNAKPYSVFSSKTDLLTIVEGDFSSYEEENRAIVVAAAKLLGLTPSLRALSALPPCRFERHGNVILDIAHNLPALEALFRRIDQPVRVVAGFSADKEVDKMIAFLRSKTDHLYLTQAAHPRAHDFGGKGIAETLDEAYTPDALIVVCGSAFMMNEAYQWLERLTIL